MAEILTKPPGMMTDYQRLLEIDNTISALSEEIIRRSHENSGHSAHVEAFSALLLERRYYLNIIFTGDNQ
mgnify:CR=1 FL=1